MNHKLYYNNKFIKICKMRYLLKKTNKIKLIYKILKVVKN